jgi:hypothetical protein
MTVVVDPGRSLSRTKSGFPSPLKLMGGNEGETGNKISPFGRNDREEVEMREKAHRIPES